MVNKNKRKNKNKVTNTAQRTQPWVVSSPAVPFYPAMMPTWRRTLSFPIKVPTAGWVNVGANTCFSKDFATDCYQRLSLRKVTTWSNAALNGFASITLLPHVPAATACGEMGATAKATNEHAHLSYVMPRNMMQPFSKSDTLFKLKSNVSEVICLVSVTFLP